MCGVDSFFFFFFCNIRRRNDSIDPQARTLRRRNEQILGEFFYPAGIKSGARNDTNVYTIPM